MPNDNHTCAYSFTELCRGTEQSVMSSNQAQYTPLVRQSECPSPSELLKPSNKELGPPARVSPPTIIPQSKLHTGIIYSLLLRYVIESCVSFTRCSCRTVCEIYQVQSFSSVILCIL